MNARRLLVLSLLLVPGGCGSPLPVDGARALARVAHQVEAGPRIPGTAGHEAILEWIVSESTRLGGRVERQSFVDSSLGHPLALTNVIARFGPSGGPRIVLCAHWDTRPFCDQDPDSTHRLDPVPGANDGGSGVAVLLEVAELMKVKPPPVGVDLVFFDGEDQGLATHSEEFSLGARAYATRVSQGSPEGHPIAAFLFDMVGDRDLGIYPEVGSSERAANLVDLVNEAARATRAGHFHTESRYRLTDDHTRLLDAGIPAVDIIDFDYPAWHTHLDRTDQVSAASLAEVAGVAAWLVYRSPLASTR